MLQCGCNFYHTACLAISCRIVECQVSIHQHIKGCTSECKDQVFTAMTLSHIQCSTDDASDAS